MTTIIIAVGLIIVVVVLGAAVFMTGQPPAPDEVDIAEWLDQHRIDDSDETKGA